jgi:hypothetical protein
MVHDHHIAQPAEVFLVIPMIILYDEIIYHLGKKWLGDAHEESLQVDSHHVGILRVILAHFPDILLKLPDTSKLALAFSTVVRTVRKLRLEQRFESQCNVMVDNAVTELTGKHLSIARVLDNKADRFAYLILT